ncbi:MAG: transposase, partial [Bradyrhizobiaceae bacterium]|nr:transposase [Bradyrhizobiaceae bacterium]
MGEGCSQRRPSLAIKDLTAIFAKVCNDFGSELKECSGADDHVHLLV